MGIGILDRPEFAFLYQQEDHVTAAACLGIKFFNRHEPGVWSLESKAIVSYSSIENYAWVRRPKQCRASFMSA